MNNFPCSIAGTPPKSVSPSQPDSTTICKASNRSKRGERASSVRRRRSSNSRSPSPRARGSRHSHSQSKSKEHSPADKEGSPGRRRRTPHSVSPPDAKRRHRRHSGDSGVGTSTSSKVDEVSESSRTSAASVPSAAAAPSSSLSLVDIFTASALQSEVMAIIQSAEAAVGGKKSTASELPDIRPSMLQEVLPRRMKTQPPLPVVPAEQVDRSVSALGGNDLRIVVNGPKFDNNEVPVVPPPPRFVSLSLMILNCMKIKLMLIIKLCKKVQSILTLHTLTL